jgi:hypothetical protein
MAQCTKCKKYAKMLLGPSYKDHTIYETQSILKYYAVIIALDVIMNSLRVYCSSNIYDSIIFQNWRKMIFTISIFLLIFGLFIAVRFFSKRMKTAIIFIACSILQIMILEVHIVLKEEPSAYYIYLYAFSPLFIYCLSTDFTSGVGYSYVAFSWLYQLIRVAIAIKIQHYKCNTLTSVFAYAFPLFINSKPSHCVFNRPLARTKRSAFNEV